MHKLSNISSVFIANRGEAALRVARAARALGASPVGCHEPDDLSHVHAMDASHPLPPRGYLDPDALLHAAQSLGADAVHPAYGFLSENAPFSQAVLNADLIFIGPDPKTVQSASDKHHARQLMQNAGVPVVPGTPVGSDDELIAAAPDVGFPLLVKAALGGGGRGIRAVHKPEELPNALASCRREAARAFQNDSCFLEKLIPRARHVEVQILGDAHGHVVHLHTRDCSVQRRRQKIIEEAPAPNLNPDALKSLTNAAVNAAKSLNYKNAGTVEFLLQPNKQFHFIEINARLQVEHTVTEEILGLDIVQLQILIADGQPLSKLLPNVPNPDGCSIQARLTAEDPITSLPALGKALHVSLPSHLARVESALKSGHVVSGNYDSLLAKIIVHAPSRTRAVQQLAQALQNTVVLGTKTNRDALLSVLNSPDFLPKNLNALQQHQPKLPNPKHLAAAAFLQRLGKDAGFRLHEPTTLTLSLKTEGQISRASVSQQNNSSPPLVSIDDQPPIPLPNHQNLLAIPDPNNPQTLHVHSPNRTFSSTIVNPENETFDEPNANTHMRASMPGVVLRILVNVGEHVRKGQVVAVVESMKMENNILAPKNGVVSSVPHQPGQHVNEGDHIVTMEENLSCKSLSLSAS